MIMIRARHPGDEVVCHLELALVYVQSMQAECHLFSRSLSLSVSVPLCLSQCLQHSTKSIRLMHSLATVSNGRCSRRGVQQQVTGTEQLVENVPFVGLKCRFERSFSNGPFHEFKPIFIALCSVAKVLPLFSACQFHFFCF